MSKPIVVAVEKASVSASREYGMTGLNWDRSGHISEEFLPQLQGYNAIKVYKEMRDNDPVVGAALFAIEMLVRNVEWVVEPADNNDVARRDAEYLEQAMDDMSHTWSDFMVEAMSAVPFGFAPFEVVYKKRQGWHRDPSRRSKFNDGGVGWRKFSIRSQDSLDSWEFDDDGGLRGMWQMAPPDYKRVFIPIEKMVIFRASQYKNNPQGRSALRNAYRPWYFKKRIEELEGIGVERDLAGIPVAYVDPEILDENASEAQKAYLNSIIDLVKNIRLDEQAGVVLPSSYDDNGHPLFKLELMGGPGGKQFATDSIIERYDQRIAMTVLADFILIGHSGTQGSFALASSRTNLFAHAIESWVDSFEDTINRHVVPRLMRLNGRSPETMPRIKHGDVSTPDLNEIASYIAQTAGAGMPWFPDERLQGWIRNLARMPAEPPGGVPVPDEASDEPEPQGRPLKPGEKAEDRRRSPRRASRETPRGTPDTPEETQRKV